MSRIDPHTIPMTAEERTLSRMAWLEQRVGILERGGGVTVVPVGGSGGVPDALSDREKNLRRLI
jgi:hypothetical protein